VKVKQKISGQFKTETAAQNFAKVQNRNSSTELRQDTLGNRHCHQKWNERIGGAQPYR